MSEGAHALKGAPTVGTAFQEIAVVHAMKRLKEPQLAVRCDPVQPVEAAAAGWRQGALQPRHEDQAQ